MQYLKLHTIINNITYLGSRLGSSLSRRAALRRHQLKSRPQPGFTIVELLIVIVVIGILAAITIVAYNGVQARAKNSQILSITTSYVKALRLYEVDNNKLPGAGYAGMNTPCLGTGYPDGICSNVGTRTESSTFNSLLQPYMASIPTVPSGEVRTNSENDFWRGVHYMWSDVTIQDIRFIQFGVSTCPAVGGTWLKTTDGATGGVVCTVSLN